MRVGGEQLAYQAAIRGWDQHRLARVSGVSEATISRLLMGQRIRPRTALRLAKALREHRPVPELQELVPSPTTDRAA